MCKTECSGSAISPVHPSVLSWAHKAFPWFFLFALEMGGKVCPGVSHDRHDWLEKDPPLCQLSSSRYFLLASPCEMSSLQEYRKFWGL